MAYTSIQKDESPLRPSSRPFHGWVMVGAAFVVMMIGFGVAYTFSAFFGPLSEEFGIDRGDTSTIFSIAGFLYFFLGAWSGPAADRIGARPVVVFGTIVTALGLYFASQAQTIEQVYWGYGLGVGVGVGCMYVPAVGVVQRWFAVKRATASGIAIMGIGVGTFAAPYAAYFMIEQFDWRTAYIGFAIAVLVFGGIGGLILVNEPALRGQYPDGANGPPQGANAGPSLTGKQARRTFPYWMIFVGALLVSLGLFIPFAHLVEFGKDLGLSQDDALLPVSAIGLGSIFGRLALGPIAQKLGRQPVVTALYIGLALNFVGWNLSTGLIHLIIFGFVFGTLYGGFVALAPTMLADYFGVEHTGSILGAVYASVGVGALLGPRLAGDMFDLTGSYETPILVGAAFCLVAAVCVMLPKNPVRWRTERFGRT
jgi:MFS family permease